MKTKAEEKAASQARAEVLAERYRSGATLQEIGDELGISRERVRQIIAKRYGSLSAVGGQSAKASKRRVDRLAARDARYMRECGCTFAEYSPLRGKPSRAFREQKRNAQDRGIGWELTFWEWWCIWRDSGRWSQRGRRADQYVMCRYGDTGPYSVGNVYIGTVSHNCSIGQLQRVTRPVVDRDRLQNYMLTSGSGFYKFHK